MGKQRGRRILIVDNEKWSRRVLCRRLISRGYQVVECESGIGALSAVWRRDVDLIILELNLPDIGGLEVIKRVRYAHSNIPMMVLSNSGDEASKVAAFDLGADDFVTRPFEVGELLARLRALQRRTQPKTEAVLFAGDVALLPAHRSAVVRGQKIRLSPREYQLLRIFVMNAGQVLAHRFILNQLWNSETDVQYLRIYIGLLRRKIEINPHLPQLILTEMGVGYQLRIPEQEAKKQASHAPHSPG